MDRLALVERFEATYQVRALICESSSSPQPPFYTLV